MKVFISHHKNDNKIAKQLYDDLKSAGAEPWLDSENLLPGQRWDEQIRKAITESSYFIALLSESTVARKSFVNDEIRFALDQMAKLPRSKVFIIPVRVQNVESNIEILNELHSVNLFESYEDGLHTLLRTILPSAKAELELTSADQKSFAIVSSKGGTGKSIIIASLGYVLAHCGFRTLLVDLDLFTHGLSYYLLADSTRRPELSLIDIFSNDVSTDAIITPIKLKNEFTNENLFLLPSVSRKRSPKAELNVSDKFNTLDAFIKTLGHVLPIDSFDYVLIDTRGGTDHTSIGAARAAGGFVLVTEADKPSWDMGGLFYETMRELDVEVETLRAGFIINKNVLPSEAIEAFLKKEWESPHLATIPLDENAIRYFQEDKVPVAFDLGCPFSVELLTIVRKLFVSHAWSPHSLSRLQAIEESSQRISLARANNRFSIEKADRFSNILRIYGTLLSTLLLAIPVYLQLTGNTESQINTTFTIMAAVLIFLITAADPKITTKWLRSIIRRPPKDRI